MFNLFKKNKKYPVFDSLKSFNRQYNYFIRIAQWDWLDDKNIWIMDPNNPRMLTLDPWPQLVFLAADGEMTVTEYVLSIANAYTGNIPEMLDETIIVELNKLEEYRIIKFAEKKQRPEDRHDLSLTQWNKQNPG